MGGCDILEIDGRLCAAQPELDAGQAAVRIASVDPRDSNWPRCAPTIAGSSYVAFVPERRNTSVQSHNWATDQGSLPF